MKDLLPRLVWGQQIFDIDSRYIIFKSPKSTDIEYANIFAERFYNDCKYEGIPLKKDLEILMVRMQLLEKDYKDLLKKLDKKLEDSKVELFLSFSNKDKRAKTKKKIASNKNQSSKYRNQVSGLLKNCLESLTEEAKNQYLFLNSVYDEAGTRLFNPNLDFSIFNALTRQINKDMLSEEDIRKFARSQVWRNAWSSKKYDVFKNSVDEFTIDQKVLVYYSELYDYAYKSDNCPSDEIFEDDDAFDGWHNLEVRKIAGAKKDRQREEFIGNVDPKYQEVFKKADSQEEANVAYDMNSELSKKFLKERTEIHKRNEVVKDIQFKDKREEHLQG